MASLNVIGFRLDDATLARVEAARARLSLPWRPATLSDVLRMLLIRGLELVEAKGSSEAGRPEVARGEDAHG